MGNGSARTSTHVSGGVPDCASGQTRQIVNRVRALPSPTLSGSSPSIVEPVYSAWGACGIALTWWSIGSSNIGRLWPIGLNLLRKLPFHQKAPQVAHDCTKLPPLLLPRLIPPSCPRRYQKAPLRCISGRGFEFRNGPGATRTRDLLLRRQALYPTELRTRNDLRHSDV